MPNQDIIFTQTDPTFLLPLDVLTELRRQNRTGFHTIISSQEAELNNVRSQAEDEAENLIFGGANRHNIASSRQAFARTFATAARMCMAKATNMRVKEWMDSPGHGRNNRAITYQQNLGDRFSLADVNDQQYYTSKYDQLYPHFLIEEKIGNVDLGRRVELNSMMLVFRNNFSEVIEIITTANATSRFETTVGMFESRIHVLCMRRKIKQGEDLENMILLKRLCGVPVRAIQQHLQDIDEAMENMSLNS